MILLETMCRSHFRKLPRLQNPHLQPLSPCKLSDSLFHPLIHRRSFSLLPQSSATSEEKSQRAEPLSQFFRNAVSGAERTNDGGTETISSEAERMKEKLRKLEEEVRSLSKERNENGKSRSPIPAKCESMGKSGAHVTLSALFGADVKEKLKLKMPIDFGLEDPKVYKELSPEMQMFAHCLYKEGYLDYANFLPKNEFDATCFEMSYGREFLKFAAVKFGEDHQKIAKWLSGSDLKKIALFGCPSYGRRSIYAAKHMRQFFQIPEQKASSKVCVKCTLRSSCKHADKGWSKSIQLSLAKVIQVLVMYAMGSVPNELVVPEEINNSVARLLKDIVNLSQLRE